MKYEYYECGKGWTPLIKEAEELVNKYNKDNPNQENPIRFTQIKEKFGYLNLYLNIYPRGLHKKLLDISKRSMNICEHCGKSGKREYIHDWVYTLCPECKEKEINRYNKLFKDENNR